MLKDRLTKVNKLVFNYNITVWSVASYRTAYGR